MIIERFRGRVWLALAVSLLLIMLETGWGNACAPKADAAPRTDAVLMRVGCPASDLCGFDECPGLGCDGTPTFTLAQDVTRNVCISVSSTNPLTSVVYNNTAANFRMYRTHACSGSMLLQPAGSVRTDDPNNWPAGWDNAVVAYVRLAIN